MWSLGPGRGRSSLGSAVPSADQLLVLGCMGIKCSQLLSIGVAPLEQELEQRGTRKRAPWLSENAQPEAVPKGECRELALELCPETPHPKAIQARIDVVK